MSRIFTVLRSRSAPQVLGGVVSVRTRSPAPSNSSTCVEDSGSPWAVDGYLALGIAPPEALLAGGCRVASFSAFHLGWFYHLNSASEI
jgi:hypothetical protein